MNPRAGILVTGTEVLTGIITDRNGPWLSERLREIGVDAASIQIVGDRADDLLDALEYMRSQGLELIVTSGGLGPTADDLTAEVVGRFAGREMVLDSRLEARIAEILRPMLSRWPGLDPEAIRASNRKQAVIPEGATVLDPVGTAPGLVVPPAAPPGPTVVVLPGPPRELHPMWETAVQTEAFKAATAGATSYKRGIVRLFGIPESEIASTLRDAEADGLGLDGLEITTCLRRGEIEVSTRYEPPAERDYEALIAYMRRRHGPVLFSEDGSTVDEQVAAMLAGPGSGCRRVVHRRVDGGSVDRAAGIVRLLSGRLGRLFKRGQGGAGRRRSGASGQGGSGLGRGGGGSRARRAAALRSRRGDRNHGNRRSGGRQRGQARGHRVLLRRGGRRRSDNPHGSAPRRAGDIRDRSTTVALHLLRRLLRHETDVEIPGEPPRAGGGRGRERR